MPRPSAASYPRGTARALLATDLVTPRTREALLARLAADGDDDEPAFLDHPAHAILRAVCARLLPQPRAGDDLPRVNLAGIIDRRLADGRGDGWRYDRMPPDGEAYRLGLRALDDSARELFGAPFTALAGEDQDALLRAVQRGGAPAERWRAVPPELFFEELLADCVEAYYSHPVALDEIGYAGYADAHGWQAVGLDMLAPHEPRPLPPAGHAETGGREDG